MRIFFIDGFRITRSYPIDRLHRAHVRSGHSTSRSAFRLIFQDDRASTTFRMADVRSSGTSGFGRCAAKPASIVWDQYRGSAYAVTAIAGVDGRPPAASYARIRLRSENPSSPGMLISIIITSTGSR